MGSSMLRRPLLFVAAGYSAAVYISFHTSSITSAVIAVMMLLVIFNAKASSPDIKRAGALFCVAFIAGSAAFALSDCSEDPIYEMASKDPGRYVQTDAMITKSEFKKNDKGDGCKIGRASCRERV